MRRFPTPNEGATFCDSEIAIRLYRRLIKNVASAISIKVPAASDIIWSPANCPAEVKFVIEIKVTSGQLNSFEPAIPNENETAK